MKNTFRNISFFLMATIVMFLSIGMSISKMKCADNSQLYVGMDVPSCSMEKEVACHKKQEKVSCCMMEIEKQCCPETKDKSCASETENIHFDFETLITEHNFNLTKVSIFFRLYFSIYIFQNNQLANNYLSGISPPKLKQPIFSHIQSFLL